MVKNLPAMRETQVRSLSWKDPLEEGMASPGEFQGERSVAWYSPWSHKESDTSEATAAAAARSIQSCPTLCSPMDCSPPGSSVRGIFQARVLEWGAIAFSTEATRHTQNTTSVLSTTRIFFFFFASFRVVGGRRLYIPQVEKANEKSFPSLSPQPHPLPEAT